MAVAEMEQDTGLLFDVLDLRAYARTKRAVDADQADPDSPMVGRVFDVVSELLRRRGAGRR